MGEHGSRCPDLNALAAFVDGRLAGVERGAIHEHLAGCADCLGLVAEALRAAPVRVEDALPASGASTSRWGRLSRLAGVVALAAALLVAVLLSESWAPRTWREPKLADLAVAAGAGRPVEGRLTGGFTHRPWSAPLAGGQGGAMTDSTPVGLVAGKIRENLQSTSDPAQLHAYGTTQILLGNWDHAAVSLAAAAREQPRNAAFHSDMAATLLARARAAGRPQDVIRALAASERARLADPQLPEAWFNYALALEAVSLRSQARSAWQQYLQLDSSSGWADEARAHLASPAATAAPDNWPGLAARLTSGADASAADQAIRTHPTEARRLLEGDLWLAWARTIGRGENATRELQRLRLVAGAFQRVGGDALYADAVDAIDRAEARGPGALDRLARAHADYAAASQHLQRDGFTAAAPLLTSSAEVFAEAGSPFSALAGAEWAGVEYYAGRGAAVKTRLARLEEQASARQYTHVAMRVAWLQGLVAFGDSDYATARIHWERMLDNARLSGNLEQEAVAHGLLANLHFVLADPGSAWAHRLASLARLTNSTSDRVRFGLLISAAGQALEESNPAAALALQAAVVEAARDSARPSALADALAQRALLNLSLGSADLALADMSEARAQVEAIPDSTARALAEPSVVTARVEVLRVVSPDEALTAAEQAVAVVPPGRDPSRLARLYAVLAELRLDRGQTEGALEAARSGLALLTGRPQPGALAAVAQRRLAGLALRVALAKGDVDNAFEFGFRARTAGPLTSEAGTAPLTLSGLQPRLRDTDAIIAMNQLDTELVLWVITGRGTRVITRPLTRSEATRLVLRQADEVALSPANPRAADLLYGEIVRPLRSALPGVTRVTIAPDAPYFAASFPAFRDPVRRRFWIEDVELTVAPALDRQGADAALGSPMVLVVDPGATAESALATWQQAPAGAVLGLPFAASANNRAPELSRVVFQDAPDQPSSGLRLARELTGLPSVGALVLPSVDPGPQPTSNAGSYDLASPFLRAGTPTVIATLESVNAPVVLLDGLRPRLEAGPSAAAAVADFQRHAIQASEGRIGTWSRLVVYGSGH